MREVKCPICNRFKRIESNVKLSICPACQIIMVETRRFCECCGEELKEDEVGYCDCCNLPEYNLERL